MQLMKSMIEEIRKQLSCIISLALPFIFCFALVMAELEFIKSSYNLF